MEEHERFSRVYNLPLDLPGVMWTRTTASPHDSHATAHRMDQRKSSRPRRVDAFGLRGTASARSSSHARGTAWAHTANIGSGSRGLHKVGRSEGRPLGKPGTLFRHRRSSDAAYPGCPRRMKAPSQLLTRSLSVTTTLISRARDRKWGRTARRA